MRWAALNPRWDLLTWRESPRLRNQREFARAETFAGKADVLRYEILAEHGGVYVDCDEEPLRPLDELELGGVTAFAGFEAKAWIANGVIGAAPGHPAIETVVRALPASVRRHDGGPVHATGPGLLTRTWLKRPDVRLFPPIVFYPVHWSRKAELGPPYPAESFGVQHWAHSWA
jgi:mannosyltransferase OCH1-like enzyme